MIFDINNGFLINWGILYQYFDSIVINFACSYTNKPGILKTVGAIDDNPSYYKWLGVNKNGITLTSFSGACLYDTWIAIGF